MDVVGVYAYRNDWDRRQIAILLPAGILGLALGWATFRYLNDNWIRVLLGCISCGFVAYSVLRRPPAPAAPNLLKGYVCGTAAGFTTFVAHAGGPPFAIYLLPLRLATAVYVGTTVVYFTVMNALKVVPYAQLGLFDARTLWTAAVMLPVAIGGMLLGLWLRRQDEPEVVLPRRLRAALRDRGQAAVRRAARLAPRERSRAPGSRAPRRGDAPAACRRNRAAAPARRC